MLHAPTNERPITELWAYLSVDEAGNEGLCGMPMMGATVPMVFGYERVARKLMPVAEQIAAMSGNTIRLVKFYSREEITSIIAPRD